MKNFMIMTFYFVYILKKCKLWIKNLEILIRVILECDACHYYGKCLCL